MIRFQVLTPAAPLLLGMRWPDTHRASTKPALCCRTSPTSREDRGFTALSWMPCFCWYNLGSHELLRSIHNPLSRIKSFWQVKCLHLCLGYLQTHSLSFLSYLHGWFWEDERAECYAYHFKNVSSWIQEFFRISLSFRSLISHPLYGVVPPSVMPPCRLVYYDLSGLSKSLVSHWAGEGDQGLAAPPTWPWFSLINESAFFR